MSTKTKTRRLFTAHFVKERETKGAIRYQEVVSATDTTPIDVGSGALIGILYIRKSALGGKRPKRLIVRVRQPEVTV
jgi:hypothetical protein